MESGLEKDMSYLEKLSDIETTGNKAYQSFYSYCGKEEIEKMKHILSPIPIWESFEQMHFANYEFSQQKIYKTIYEYDANSSFTFGALQLPDGFNLLKEKVSSTTNKTNIKIDTSVDALIKQLDIKDKQIEELTKSLQFEQAKNRDLTDKVFLLEQKDIQEVQEQPKRKWYEFFKA